MFPDIKNKKIIVTGASRGLGAEAAVALAELGANLLLIARTKKDLEAVRMRCKNPNRHLSIAADLTNIELLENSIQKAKSFLKSIDCIVHAAGGGLKKYDPLLDFKDLMLLFTLNVGAAAQINNLVIPDMVKRKRGNIVHVGSIAGRESIASVGYCTAKAALNMYVRSLGREFAGTGIVITGVNPGGFIAPGNSMERLRTNNPEHFKNFAEKLPRKRLAEASEIIPMVLFLCSDKASMMGGCMVPIDAGEGIST